MLWEFSIVSSLSWYSILVQHACNDRAWLTSEGLPRYHNLVWGNRRDSRHVMSWFNYWLALNLCKNDIFIIVSRFSVQHFLILFQRHKKHENWLKIVNQTSVSRDRLSHRTKIIICQWVFGSQPRAVIVRVLNMNTVSWQTRNNWELPKHKLSQNAKNLQCLPTFGLIEDIVTGF